MKLKYYFCITLFLIAILCLSAGSVSAGWFGYDNGECDSFSITPPQGFHNAGELTYTESLFLSSGGSGEPYHSLHVYQIRSDYSSSNSEKNELNTLAIICDEFIDFDEKDIEVIDTVDEGNFKAYKTYNSHEAFSENTTYAYFKDGQYEYQLELSHKNCAYDDTQFKKDVILLKNVAYSINRK